MKTDVVTLFSIPSTLIHVFPFFFSESMTTQTVTHQSLPFWSYVIFTFRTKIKYAYVYEIFEMYKGGFETGTSRTGRTCLEYTLSVITTSLRKGGRKRGKKEERRQGKKETEREVGREGMKDSW